MNVTSGRSADAARTDHRLPGYALFAGLLAMAGLPIYIHAPKFYVDEFGVALGALGSVLFALRALDFVQDPLLGWLADATRAYRAATVHVAGLIMALAFYGLFAVPPPVAPLLWFALTLTALFSAFSFLTICFYAQGVLKGEALGGAGHVRLAAWRETGALLGVCLAAVAPTVLVMVSDAPFAYFAFCFAGLTVVAIVAMQGEWQTRATTGAVAMSGLWLVLGDRVSRRLLLVALFNATPVAVTSTLFLFFVESRLQGPGWEGPLLLLFFLAAAVSVPFWTRTAATFGTRPTLLAGMGLAIVAFGFVATLGPGDIAAFALICIASGAALGADMSLLPALFSRRMAQVSPNAAQGFGLWAFVTKATLAIAAIVLLPLLEMSGFSGGPDNPPEALVMLTILYALVPCVLKLVGIMILAATPLDEG